ncbi:MAG: CoA pyrophosphatase [Hyphomicrobium sp.]
MDDHRIAGTAAGAADAFRRLALSRLHPATPSPGSPGAQSVHTPSDFDLNPEALAMAGTAEELRPAAVLVPVVARALPMLLLTRRTDHLPQHAGQIAFPGGKIDKGDGDATRTALREAHEEVGLESRHVEILGLLDPYRTGTGYWITPVVALVDPGCALVPNPFEVAEVFEVPLAFAMDRRNIGTDTRIIAGHERRYFAIRFGNYYIWGATAGILMNMQQRLFGS